MKNFTLVHVPHASTIIPKQYLYQFNIHKLSYELKVMTDRYCDELFDNGSTMIKTEVSRLVCDVERFRDDKDEIMANIGMGAVYKSCSDLSLLRKFSNKEKQHILKQYYDTHHNNFEKMVEEKIRLYDKCLIIDGHSFYPTPLPYELNQDKDRPDFCIGTDSFHTSEEMTRKVYEFFSKKGFSVKINKPFAGTIVPMKYYGKDKRVYSIMIEINRKLYMEEPDIKNDSFSYIKNLVEECVKIIEQSV